MRLGLGLKGLKQRLLGGAPAAPVLGTITISDASYTSGASESGTFGGDSAGSTLSITGQPTGFTFNSGARTWAFDGTATAGSGTFAITETLAGATGSPKLTNIGWTVATGAGGLDPSISAPTLTLATANLTYPPQFDIGLDDTAVVGDTIRLQWDNNADFGSITGDATNTIDAAEASANAATFTGLSSISSGTHRFRARVERGASYSDWSNVVTQGPDDVAPTITSGNPSGTYPEITPISGTLTANETVTWSKSGTNAAAVTLNASTGAWSYTPDFETAPNPTWTFTATDGNGNTSSQVVTLTITDVTEATFSLTEVAAPANVAPGFAEYTYTGQNFGSPDPTRKLLAIIIAFDGGNYPTVTIGGVAATKISTNTPWISAFEASVPTGSSGDVAIGGGGWQGVGLRLFRVVASTGSAVVTQLNAGFHNSPQTVSATTVSGGGTAVAAYIETLSGGPAVWGGGASASNPHSNNVFQTIASATRTSASTAAITVSGFGNQNASMIAVSYAP